MTNDPAATSLLEASVRPVIEAYKNWTGVSDSRWDTATDAQMVGGAAYPGYPDFRAGWDAAVSTIAAEVERLTWAIDHGGNKYRRPAAIDRLEKMLKALRS